MEILQLPLTDSFIITVFNSHSRYAEYSVSKQGYVIFNKTGIETEFSNRHLSFHEHKMLGLVSNMDEDKVKKLYDSAEIEAPYLDYTDITKTFDSALDSFKSFLNSNGWAYPEDRTWVIIPKPSKNLTGKKFPLEFLICGENFRTMKTEELEVFMSPITKTSKSLKFSVKVPKYIYNKCMTDPEVEQRPKLDYIETDTISTLHTLMDNYSNQATKVEDIEKNANNSEKVICINFFSKEELTRDDYNHAYTGQNISIKFNHFIAYKIISPSFGSRMNFFTYKKYQSGNGMSDKGIKGIIDTESRGVRQYIMTTPKVYVKWTQEREDFLDMLEERFRSLSKNLNDFLADIDEDKIEKLIANANNLKLLGN